MKRLLPLIAAISLSVLAMADDRTGPYASLSIGANILGNETIDVTSGADVATAEASFSASFAGGGAVGYRFANNFSVEGEFLYRRAELDSVDLGLIGQFADGDFANTQINLNAYYHFNLVGDSDIETYVGAGMAYINEVDIDLEDAAGSEREFEADEFGIELMAGARYPVLERGFIDLGVRYLPLGDVNLERTDGSGDSVNSDYSPFMATVKFGWRF